MPGQTEGDIVPYVQVGKEGVVLEDQAHASGLGRQGAARRSGDGAVDADLAFVKGLQSGNHFQERALSASGGAEQAGDAAFDQAQLGGGDDGACPKAPGRPPHLKNPPHRESSCAGDSILRVSQTTAGAERARIMSEGRPA